MPVKALGKTMDIHPAARCSKESSSEKKSTTVENKNAFDVVRVGGGKYIAHFGPYLYHMRRKYKKKPLVFASSDQTWSPMAIMNFRGGISIGRFKRKLSSLEAEDDVFNRGFLKTLVLLMTAKEEALKAFLDSSEGQGIKELVESWGVKRIHVLPIINENYFREGPYFHSLKGTFEAWKLIQDDVGAFMESALPPTLKIREPFTILAELGEPPRRQIAIRSRLHCKRTHPGALNNYRIAFDDMFCVQGLSDGKGLCAHRSVALDSSTLVRWAVKLDGKVVGKTKVSQFNSSHKLIEDGIGAETASNCRSQRYRAFGGTSCGGAAALAAYSCLDIAVGIDCGGNIRNAAVTHLLYAFKPSYLLDDTFDPGKCCLIWSPENKDFAKTYQLFSTPSFLARSISTLRASLSLNPEIAKLCKRYPYFGRLLFPTNYYVKNYEAVQDLVEVFVSKLARYLELRADRKSLHDIWIENGPPAMGLSYNKYFETTFADLQWFEHPYGEERDQLRYSGYLHPFTKQYWNELINVEKERRYEALDKMFIHNKWFLESVMECNTPLVDTILVIPRFIDSSIGKNSYDPSERLYNRFDSNYHASLSGCPNLIVPIGQVPAPSSELSSGGMIPVSVSIIAPRGSDAYFLYTIEKFMQRTKLRTEVMAGELAFDVDETEKLLKEKSSISANDTDGLTVNWRSY